MTSGWYILGKYLNHIDRTKAWSHFEYKSWEHYRNAELPDFDPTVISKIKKVSGVFRVYLEGEIQQNPKYVLPSYEACYRLINKKEDMTNAEYQRLRRGLISHKISFSELVRELCAIQLRKDKTESSKADEALREIDAEVEALVTEPVDNLDDVPQPTLQKMFIEGVIKKVEALIDDIPDAVSTLDMMSDANLERLLFKERLAGLSKVALLYLRAIHDEDTQENDDDRPAAGV